MLLKTNQSVELDVLWHRSVAFVEVGTAIVEPEDIGESDSETMEVEDHAHQEVELVVNPICDKRVPWGRNLQGALDYRGSIICDCLFLQKIRGGCCLPESVAKR